MSAVRAMVAAGVRCAVLLLLATRYQVRQQLTAPAASSSWFPDARDTCCLFPSLSSRFWFSCCSLLHCRQRQLFQDRQERNALCSSSRKSEHVHVLFWITAHAHTYTRSLSADINFMIPNPDGDVPVSGCTIDGDLDQSAQNIQSKVLPGSESFYAHQVPDPDLWCPCGCLCLLSPGWDMLQGSDGSCIGQRHFHSIRFLWFNFIFANVHVMRYDCRVDNYCKNEERE